MRRRTEEAEASYDSVLDTMTNVVGILIIVVAVTQLSVGDAVRRSSLKASEVPALTVEEFDLAQAEVGRTRTALATLRERWGVLSVGTPELRSDLHGVQTAITELEDTAEDPEEFRVQHEDLGAKPPELNQVITALEADEQALAVQLEKLRESVTQADIEFSEQPSIQIPYPRPEEASGKTLFRFYCRRGQVFPAEADELWDESLAQIAKILGVSADSIPVRDLQNKAFEVQKAFEENDFGTELFYMKIIGQNQDGFDLGFGHFLRDTAEGWTLEDLASGGSGLREKLAELGPEDYWVQFRVHDDSFEAYLHARRVAESMGFSIGWTPALDTSYIYSKLVGDPGSGSSTTPVPDGN